MSPEDRLTAFTAASPSVDYVAAASVSTAQPGAEIDTPAVDEARAAVAEYLRDLGLRDPDVIATEARRIVAAAQHNRAAPTLTEAALRITVRRLEHFLALLAAQAGAPDEVQRLTIGIAARLPALLGEFPKAFSAKQVLGDVAATLYDGVAPVVPPPRPQRMRRQRLSLVPAALQNLASFVRGEQVDD